MKRSGNKIANWFIAAFHSRGCIFPKRHLRAALESNSNSNSNSNSHRLNLELGRELPFQFLLFPANLFLRSSEKYQQSDVRETETGSLQDGRQPKVRIESKLG